MKLSIIIPTYNEERFLPRLLESIKQQDFKDYEVIVADAGSKDNTKKIAKKYGCKIVKGGSPAEGRNKGAKVAKGRYLLFLDSDVVLSPNYISEAISEFEKRHLGIAITQMIPITDREIDKIMHDFANLFFKAVERIKPHGAGCCGILTRKNLHNEVNGFDEVLDFGEDTDYIERIGAFSNFRVLNKPRLLVSTRRLEKEGRAPLAMKYTKSTLLQFAGKKVTAAELDYGFGYPEGKRRILYAVCGEGMGHAIRSVPIINHLKKKNEVLVVASGKAYDYLKKKFDSVLSIEGFYIVYENNVVNSKKTFLNALKKLPKDLEINMKKLYHIIKRFHPNMIISDFEFFSNIIAKLMGIPMISVGNHHIQTKTKVKVPAKYIKDKATSFGVIRTFAVRPKKYLITTFFFPPVKNPKRAWLFPPVLREDILKLKPKVKKHVLVYQTSDSYNKLIPELKKLEDINFIVYGMNNEKKEGNIQFRKFNETKFMKEFAECYAVITNGGFTLIGEALHLGKPVLSVPVKKQFEQILNAIYLERLGYGEFKEDLDAETVAEFLAKSNSYRATIKKKYKREDNSKILRAIDTLLERYSKRYKKTKKRK